MHYFKFLFLLLIRYNLWWRWSSACSCGTTGELHHAGWRPWICALSTCKLFDLILYWNGLNERILTLNLFAGYLLTRFVFYSPLWRVWLRLKRQWCETRRWSPCERSPMNTLQWTWKCTLSLWWSVWPVETGSHHVPLPVDSSVSATREFPAQSKLRSASKFNTFVRSVLLKWCIFILGTFNTGLFTPRAHWTST